MKELPPVPETLQSLRIERFKRIRDATFDLGTLNVLVGANNSGKSSIIQGLHFAIAVLQTIGLAKKFPTSSNNPLSMSLGPNQLIYSPSENAYALGTDGKLQEDSSEAIAISFTLTTGEQCSIRVRKGRNRNLLVSVEHPQTAKKLSKLEHPFSIFSPGLAGVAKTESYVSDGVLLRTLARGDANLVLRNILLRLWNTAEWDPFLQDLHMVFPGSDIKVAWEKKSDEFINVQMHVYGSWVPFELAGTGILQAAQILSYIHRFAPNLVVLDEPDSHLHPNNQRLLCALLRRIAEDRSTQVLLTTHSRHVVDAVGHSSGFLWVRDGTVDSVGPDQELGVLLDIGALDVKERAGDPNTRAVVLTEDALTQCLECLLTASGFKLQETAVLPYYGISGIKQLRPLVNVIYSTNPSTKIIIHRDRDYLSDSEVHEWCKQVRALKVETFVTDGVDIESHFLAPEHLAELNPEMSLSQFQTLLDEVRTTKHAELVEHFVNGMIDLARKQGTHGKLNYGKLATDAQETVAKDSSRFHKGKTVLASLRTKYQNLTGENLRSIEPTQHLRHDMLATFSRKTFGDHQV